MFAIRRFRPAAVLALCALGVLPVLLAACGGRQQPAPQAQEQALPARPILEFMTGNPAGSSAVLDDPEFGTGIRVVVEGLFISATGEECRRATLLSEHGEAEVVIACRPVGSGDADAWQMAPRIWGQGISRPPQ
ncbi:DVU3141 family protein [Nitratidesulfovibrio sp. 1201_IL3209]|uniref:DVU3141 family protein n=1 Tax=Nitratidesulfovibrio sp. 1201_IL3209 TaxID=3084053 RepID=UPI002FDAB84C